MDFTEGKIVPIGLEEEMRRSYLNFAMYVIVDRALPDVRDGLKPVQRRILNTMLEIGLRPDRPFKKSARVVGETMAKYHPHGDSAIYDAMVRMGQDFSYRYMLVQGHGNFGCFTGDTKIKLVDGTEKSFAELAKLGPEGRFYVYSYDRTKKEIVVAEGRNSRITRRNAQLIELTLDTGEKIKCTPDHRFLLKSGEYKQAQHLTPEDSLAAGYFSTAPVREGTNDYLRVLQPNGNWSFVHHLADEYNERIGRARSMSEPWVRHHVDFDRWNNAPDNIRRVTFQEHNRIHAEHVKSLWRDPDFRAKQRRGVRKYYADNPEVLEERVERFRRQNTDPSFREANGKRVAKALKEFYRRHPERRKALSEAKKALWKDPDFRQKMSEALTGIEKRELSAEEKERIAAIISEKSRAMWSDPQKREEIVAAIQEAMNDPELRQALSENAKRLWADPDYRAKFGDDHFSKMAKALWSRPETREFHSRKIARQRANDPEFNRRQSEGVTRSNYRRLSEDPSMMKKLAERSAQSLTQKWKDPEYKRQVMQSRISGYVTRLLVEEGKENFSPELYDSRRDANWIPRFETAITYFDSLDEMIERAEQYNHRVVAIRWLTEREDVYDITVDTYHNFLLSSGVFVHNSIDGDPPAAMRYTEARLSRLAMEMLRDIDKDTVDYGPNFDDSLEQPLVLPSRFPNLLVNGATGIAVGMSTNIPPHNLSEVTNALIEMIDNPEITVDGLMKHIKGPDFPTGGLILGREGIRDAYRTGRGRVRMRARVRIEQMQGGKQRILITEIPYMVNKANLVEKIAELHNEKKVDGITALRDESDRNGMRIVIELRRDVNPNIVLNQLYKHSQLQETFGVIMLALVNGEPKILDLKGMLYHYLEHQRDVVTRRTKFELRKAEDRAHILEGYRIALDHIDEIIQLIRNAESDQDAKVKLMERFGLSERQAVAILDMQLRRLTGLEREKIESEYQELLKTIAYLKEILGDERKLFGIIKDELTEIRDKFGDERRTEITSAEGDIDVEDLIAEEDIVVTLTHHGYIKRLPLTSYRSQKRGGRGVTALSTRSEDFVEHLFITTTHTYIVFFTNKGRVYRLRAHEIPEAGRNARGTAIINLIQIEPGEQVQAAIPIQEYDDRYLFIATRNGTVKKTVLSEFDSSYSGLIALTLDDDDEVIGVQLTDGNQDMLLVTGEGQAIRFHEGDVRPMGRTARGVRGITLEEGDAVVGMDVVYPDRELLVVTANGFGKRTPLSEYRITGRGGKGIRTIQKTDRNGPITGIKVVREDDEVMLISLEGIMIRFSVQDVSRLGRSTQGVRLMRLGEADRVVALAQVVSKDDENDDQPSLL